MAKIITVRRSVFSANERVAAENRTLLDRNGVRLVNVMGAPGSGKTTLILATAPLLAPLRCGVIEGDVAGDLDAREAEAAGLPAVQVNTGGSCHLRADMVAEALRAMPLAELDLLFVENVGNLVCPAGVSLGEHANVVLSSTPEGDDKPEKYPAVFRTADAVIVTKAELAELAGFSLAAFEARLRRLNALAPLFVVSARTGAGMAGWAAWLRERAGGGLT